MTLEFSANASRQLAEARDRPGGQAYRALVARLIELENLTSAFAELRHVFERSPATEGFGPLFAHVIEADPPTVWVIHFRFRNPDDVAIVDIRGTR